MEQLQEYLGEVGLQELTEAIGINLEEFTVEALVEFLEDQNQPIIEVVEDTLHEYISVLNEELYEDVLIKLDYEDVINFCSSKKLHICSDRWFWFRYAKRRYGVDLEDIKEYNLYWTKRAVKVVSESKKDFESKTNQLLLDEYVEVVIRLDNLKKLNFIYTYIGQADLFKIYDIDLNVEGENVLKSVRFDAFVLMLLIYVDSTLFELEPLYTIEEYNLPELHTYDYVYQFIDLIIHAGNIREKFTYDYKQWYMEYLFDSGVVMYIVHEITKNTKLTILEYYELYKDIDGIGEEIFYYTREKLELELWTIDDINRQLEEMADYYNDIFYDGYSNWSYIHLETLDYIPFETLNIPEGSYIGFDISDTGNDFVVQAQV